MKDRVFIAAGVVGLLLAMAGALGAPRPDALGIGAAAVVNGRPIPQEAVARAMQALENDKRNPVTQADARAALERLIDEELLVQRGVALDLAATDLAARKALVQSVLQLAVAERAGAEPDEAALRKFYAQNRGYFTPAPRVAASLVFIARDSRMRTRTQTAQDALRRGLAAASLGDPTPLALPGGLLSEKELRTYLGASLAAEALQGKAGDVIAAEEEGGVRLLRIDRVEAPRAARYEDVSETVRSEWGRRADEAAVRAYLERLRRRARITRAS